MNTEHTVLVKKCLEWLAIEGYFAWPNNTHAVKVADRYLRGGQPGSSDIFTLLPQESGRLCGIEVKISPDKQKDKQKIFQMMVERNKGKYIIVRDSLDDLVRQMPRLSPKQNQSFPPAIA